MRIEHFEDLQIWKEARRLTKEIYRLTSGSKFSRDFGLRDQIQRAAVSVMSNIAEGFERGGNQEFAQFLYVAKGSCGELRSNCMWQLTKHMFQQMNRRGYSFRSSACQA